MLIHQKSKRNLHLELVKKFWTRHLRSGDYAVDATCGNGHDTLFLAQQEGISVVSLDIQKEALQNTALLLEKSLSLEVQKKVLLVEQSHSTFPPFSKPPRLIIYNLGYLPGGDKNVTTKTETTLQSLRSALQILAPDGAISLMCYPGHAEGLLEQEAIINFLDSLKSSYTYERYHYTDPPHRDFQLHIPENSFCNRFPNFFWICSRASAIK